MPPRFETPEGASPMAALVRKNDPRFQSVKDPMEFDKPNITVVVAAGEAGDDWERVRKK